VDFSRSELQESVWRETLALANSFGLDYWRGRDRDAAYPWEFVRAFAAAGWLGTVIPGTRRLAWGVRGWLALHAIGRSGAGTSGASAIHFYIFPLTPVIRHGPEYLKQTCPRAARRAAVRVRRHRADRGHRYLARFYSRGPFGRPLDRGWSEGLTTNAQHAERILLWRGPPASSPRRHPGPDAVLRAARSVEVHA
jgi:hypothetical protein